MTIEVLPQEFSVCKVADVSALTLASPFSFSAWTDNECSLVCPSETAPSLTRYREDGWRAMRIVGLLAFSMVGVLAYITRLMAEADISVFALSTFDTDYWLLKEDRLERAISVLEADGCTVIVKNAID